MTADICGETVLQPTEWCVARPQVNRQLVYNSRTDEMHLVPQTGMIVYGMCDGLRTVGEIEQALIEALPDDPATVRSSVRNFLDNLVTRGIVEVIHG